jgi:hypothetical protein
MDATTDAIRGEAIAALTAQAWTEPYREDDYKRALDEVLSFCGAHENVQGVFTRADVPIPPSEIRRVVTAALGPKRTSVHCISHHGFGADWDLEEAIKAVREAPSVAWGDSLTGHDLTVVDAAGKVWRFQVTKPGTEPAPKEA